MPQDIEFVLPFPLRINTDLERARDHNLQWVQRLGLVAGGESLAWFSMWDMPKLAALGFPYATGEGLDLCADAMAFFFVFDDQFDGPLGRHPDRVAGICQGVHRHRSWRRASRIRWSSAAGIRRRVGSVPAGRIRALAGACGG